MVHSSAKWQVKIDSTGEKFHVEGGIFLSQRFTRIDEKQWFFHVELVLTPMVKSLPPKTKRIKPGEIEFWVRNTSGLGKPLSFDTLCCWGAFVRGSNVWVYNNPAESNVNQSSQYALLCIFERNVVFFWGSFFKKSLPCDRVNQSTLC